MGHNDARDGAVVTPCMLTHAYAELECYHHMLLAIYTHMYSLALVMVKRAAICNS